jgi:uncharacterized protein with HEPN domain
MSCCARPWSGSSRSSAKALSQLSREDPDTAGKIPDLARIVAFRNVLIHAYASVDDELVWSVATEKVAALVASLNELLGER